MTSSVRDPARTAPSLLRRHWPALAGFGFAAFVLVGVGTGIEVAPVLAAAATMYLGAAALGRPSSAWLLFFVTVVVITAARVAGLAAGVRLEPTWVILAGAVGLLGYGLFRGATRPPSGLPLQTAALLGFGAVAAAALLLDPVVGSYLVAAGLLAHAGWDLHHYRTNRVVVRSLAEFCLVLDATLAVVIVVLTVLG